MDDQFKHLLKSLETAQPQTWQDIHDLLADPALNRSDRGQLSQEEFLQRCARGSAFLTFEYGIDGVSIEIAKYVRALSKALGNYSPVQIHLIGGDFQAPADRLFNDSLPRHLISGINGWSKWDGGRWFSGLFYQDMPQGSEVSRDLATEIFSQALTISEELGNCLMENDISLLIPVNVASNPGNLALTIGLVIVTEALGLHVINSNHDFYWEGGRPAGQRAPGSRPGVRDHFFRNAANRPFFEFFRTLYPWNGKRWLQVNINSRQSVRLTERFRLPERRVAEFPTSVSDALFEPFTFEDVRSARQRMAIILSDGRPALKTISLSDHLKHLDDWMADQQPIALGVESGIEIDPSSPDLIYLLQPTRLVARKRISRDIELIHAMLERSRIKDAFKDTPRMQLILHITGPVPVEHQYDLERILHAFRDMLAALPQSTARRITLAFSVGREEHPLFKTMGLSSLRIADIYRMASVVLFPSQTEGRGLPIIESAAVGIPIICSRYKPESVFSDVVGEQLPPEMQLHYTLFPEGEFTPSFLDQVADLILDPDEFLSSREHNRNAVRARFSLSALTTVWQSLLAKLAELP